MYALNARFINEFGDNKSSCLLYTSYRISDDGNKMECMVELEDGTVLDLPEDKWTAVIKSGLDACGFSGGQNVRNITLKEA